MLIGTDTQKLTSVMVTGAQNLMSTHTRLSKKVLEKACRPNLVTTKYQNLSRLGNALVCTMWIENQIASWLQRLTKQVTTEVPQEIIKRGIKVIAELSKKGSPHVYDRKVAVATHHVRHSQHGSRTFTHQCKNSTNVRLRADPLRTTVVFNCAVLECSCPATLVPSSIDAGTSAHHTNESLTGLQSTQPAVFDPRHRCCTATCCKFVVRLKFEVLRNQLLQKRWHYLRNFYSVRVTWPTFASVVSTNGRGSRHISLHR